MSPKIAMGWRSEALLVPILALLLYIPTLRYGWLQYDDTSGILQHPAVYGIAGWGRALFAASPLGEVAPLTTYIHRLLYQFGNGVAWPFHLLNVLLHALNGYLVVRLIERLSANRRLAIITGLLFVSHPLQVESVSWISARKDLQVSALLLLFSNLCLRPKESSRQTLLQWCLLVAAALSKVSGIVAAPLAIWADAVKKRLQPASRRRWLLHCGTALSLFIYFYFVARQSGTIGVASSTLLTRLWAAVGSLGEVYIAHLLVPLQLSPSYAAASMLSYGHVITLLAIGLIALLLKRWRQGNHRQLLLAVGSFAVICFLPYCNWFATSISAADRYFYLPLVAFCTAVALLIMRCRAPQRTLLLGGLLIVWGTLNLQTQQIWSSDVALWQRATMVTPTTGNRLAYIRALLASRQSDAAWEQLALLTATHEPAKRLHILGYQAIALWQNPQRTALASRLTGDIYTQLQLLPRQAIDKDLQQIYFSLAASQMAAGDDAGAIVAFEELRQWLPNEPLLFYNLAKAYLHLGNLAQAIELYQQCLALQPSNRYAWQDLALAYQLQGNVVQAAAAQARAAALQPLLLPGQN